ncbi:hypothetical protein FGO68_gene9677 [Halteria grandinella]|uniref:Uncharacterized protein n=1 Tax=Halteria grandinella TaxID=5974 RepID=A0A8J8NZ62_HALGN|nr:hypothetical protein FGO68_gene9677 [Halteria grandinella]
MLRLGTYLNFKSIIIVAQMNEHQLSQESLLISRDQELRMHSILDEQLMNMPQTNTNVYRRETYNPANYKGETEYSQQNHFSQELTKNFPQHQPTQYQHYQTYDTAPQYRPIFQDTYYSTQQQQDLVHLPRFTNLNSSAERSRQRGSISSISSLQPRPLNNFNGTQQTLNSYRPGSQRGDSPKNVMTLVAVQPLGSSRPQSKLNQDLELDKQANNEEEEVSEYYDEEEEAEADKKALELQQVSHSSYSVTQSRKVLKESDLVVPKPLEEAKQQSPRQLSMDESSIKQGSTVSKQGLDITQEHNKIVDLQIANTKPNAYSEMGDISGGNKLSEYGRPSEATHYSKYGGAKNAQKKEDKAYLNMQSNLKSLQDKIKDLETKLNRVNAEDTNSLILSQEEPSVESSALLARYNNDMKNRLNTSNHQPPQSKGLTSSTTSVRDKENTCPAPIVAASYYGSAIKSSLKATDEIIPGKKLAWEDLSTNSRGRQSFGKSDRPVSAAFKEQQLPPKLQESAMKANSKRTSLRRDSIGQSPNQSTSSIGSGRKSSQVNNKRKSISRQDSIDRRSSASGFENKTAAEQIKYLRDELNKERRKNIGLERQLEAYQKASSLTGTKEREKLQQKYTDLKSEHKQLMEAFEKSERIRSEQKELIQNLKRDMMKVRTVQILNEEDRASTKVPDSSSPAPIINLEVVQRSHHAGFKQSRNNTKGILNIQASVEDQEMRQTRKKSKSNRSSSKRKMRSRSKGKEEIDGSGTAVGQKKVNRKKSPKVGAKLKRGATIGIK